MSRCSKCGEETDFLRDIQDKAYCKRCSPITEALITLLNESATNRNMLPVDLAAYFADNFVGYTDYTSGPTFVCRNCNCSGPHYEWYDNNDPSTFYWYCTSCNTLSRQID